MGGRDGRIKRFGRGGGHLYHQLRSCAVAYWRWLALHEGVASTRLLRESGEGHCCEEVNTGSVIGLGKLALFTIVHENARLSVRVWFFRWVKSYRAVDPGTAAG